MASRHAGGSVRERSQPPPDYSRRHLVGQNLGERFFIANTVLHRGDGSLAVTVAPKDGDETAALASLRPDRFHRVSDLPFAVNNESHVVEVAQVETETKAGRQSWRLTLNPSNDARGSAFAFDGSYSTEGKTFTPEDFAEMRAGRILLNDPPRRDSRRGFGHESVLESFIEGHGGKHPVRECAIREVFREYGDSPVWREYARLKAVFLLRASGTVEHVLDLRIGAARGGKVPVKFRGRMRRRYSNEDPAEIKVEGVCLLA